LQVPVPPSPFGRIQYGKLIQVSPHVYLFRHTVNSGVVIAEDGVAVIDTQISEPMAHRLIRAVRQVTDKPFRWAINTHYHWDHWAGNDVFARHGATVVSGRLTKEFMQRRNGRQRAFLTGRGFSMPPTDPQHASITFDGKLDLQLGKLQLELRHIGSAETDDATAVFVPSDGIAMSGDTLMTSSFPILGQPTANEGMKNDRAWIQTLKNLKAWGAKAVLPGHGEMAGDAEIDFFIELQDYFLTTVEALHDQLLTDAQIIAKMEAEMPAKYAKMPTTWGTPRYAILRALRSFRGWQLEKPIVIPAAPQDLEAATAGLTATAATYRDAAEQALNKDRLDLAIAILAAGTKAFSDDPSIWTAHARLLIESARVEPSVLEKGDYFIVARRELERALELDAQFAPALVTLGGFLAMSCYRGGDDPAPAFAYLDRALQQPLDERDKAQAHFFRGMGFRACEDEERAQAEFRQAIAADATFPPPHMAIAAGDDRANAGPRRAGA
jgi:glyoxylase-like metal-dependent hydrolase (beta-lactamase superfamily II)/Tfp pilus assembly protein PilF